MSAAPSISGTYALVFRADEKHEVKIGRLGALITRPGYYLYVGSAFGPGGLAARITRHLRPTTQRHWHIDYLKPFVQAVEVAYTGDPVRREHAWARALDRAPELVVVLPRFGASDCRCATHLWWAAQRMHVTHALSGLASGCRQFQTKNAGTMAD